jgi:flagellar biosynthesis/type III secretory pathway protein FliH
MLEQENKKMEEKLQMVQKMMELERQKRSAQGNRSGKEGGTMWRSATTNQSISGYGKAVENNMRK